MANRNKKTYSKLEVINNALGLLGSDRVRLQNLTDTSTISQQTELHFIPSLEELIRMHAWNCCLERKVISATVGAASPFFAHEKAWNPTGTAVIEPLRVISRHASDAQTGGVVRPQTEWTVYRSASSSTGANAQLGIASTSNTSWRFYYLAVPIDGSGNIIYGRFDSLFINCWTTYLASKLAVPVLGNVNRKFELLKRLYEVLLPQARKVNTLEGNYPYVNENDVELPTPFSYTSIKKV